MRLMPTLLKTLIGKKHARSSNYSAKLCLFLVMFLRLWFSFCPSAFLPSLTIGVLLLRPVTAAQTQIRMSSSSRTLFAGKQVTSHLQTTPAITLQLSQLALLHILVAASPSANSRATTGTVALSDRNYASSFAFSPFRCIAAVNGGIFGWSKGWKTPLDERCSLGIVVCNGSTWSSDPAPQPVFAMSSSCNIYVGNFPYSLFPSASITNAVSGQAIIVLNGTAQPFSYVPPSAPRHKFHFHSSHKNAPRTALGHDVSGRIMTLQVDGDESENTGKSAYFF